LVIARSELLRHAGVARVVCTNSVNAPESEIGLSELLSPRDGSTCNAA
jgi:hypothetical protein